MQGTMVATTPTAVRSTATTTSNAAIVATVTKPTKRRPRETSEKQESLLRTARSTPRIMHERDNVVRIPNQSSVHFLRGSTATAASTATSTSATHTNNRNTRILVSDGDWRIQTPLPLQHIPQHTTASTNSNPTNSDGIYVAHSCLLIPVVVAVWWFWTKRAAKRVLRKLTMLPEEPCGPSSYSMNMSASGVSCSPAMHNDHAEQDNNMHHHYNYSNYGCADTFVSDHADTTTPATSSAAAHAHMNGQHQQQQQQHQQQYFEKDTTDDDKFNTWEDVLENETSDPSVRFVRWIKGKNYKAKRRMEAVSRFSLRRRNHQHQHHNGSAPASAGSGLGPEGDGLDKTTPILQGNSNSILQVASSSGDDATISLSTAESVSIKPAKQRSAWQCIQDTGVEICAIQTKDSKCDSVVLLSTNEILENASPTSAGTTRRGEGMGAFYA
jgi:hypothetical protein